MARSPIYTALRDSPYHYTFGTLKFRFSSQFHADKFSKGLANRVSWLNDSLSRRFRCIVNFPEVAALQWYEMCETRGYCVERLLPDGRWVTYTQPTVELKSVVDG